MRILFLSSWFPYPPTNGAKIRIYNLIRELASDHDVTLLAFARTINIREAEKHVPWLEQFCQSVEVVQAHPYDASSMAAYAGYFSLKPRSVFQTYSREMADVFKEKLRSQKYDVVIASEVNMPSVVSLLAAESSNVPFVLDAIEVGLAKDAYYGSMSLLSKVRNGLTWLKLKRFTRDVLNRSVACTVPSQVEKHNLSSILPGYEHIEVIPHSLDLSRYSQLPVDPEPETLVFMGSFAYYPNLDAVRYFSDEIFPLVKEQLPNTVVQILGSTEGVSLDFFPIDSGFNFVGYVQDVRTRIAQSWLSIVPLRIGAGTRLKIIESMALGTPVVSTSKGAEGLDLINEEHILIADTPVEFANSVVRLLRSSDLRHKLAEAGLKCVRERFDSKVMGRDFNLLLDQVISN